VITGEEEELLWSSGQLGDSTPQQLLDTMVFCCGLHFSLRSGKEHRQLQRTPCQIQLEEKQGQEYLVYREDVSKNHPGGLRGCNIKPKFVQNTTNPQRCFVRQFKNYQALCSPDAPAHSFYLRHSHPPPTAGSRDVQLDITHFPTLWPGSAGPGVEGYKTNHSLRATSTSRLYQSGVDKQLVMERSGHCSVKVTSALPTNRGGPCQTS
jgi:hypothetical protein